MSAFLATVDWVQVVSVIWTVVLVPFIVFVRNKIEDWSKLHKVEKYSALLEKAIEDVVRDVQGTLVDGIKGTEEWTPEKIEEIKSIAWNKAVASMTYEGYQLLSGLNDDFDTYIQTIIEAKLYDLKAAAAGSGTYFITDK